MRMYFGNSRIALALTTLHHIIAVPRDTELAKLTRTQQFLQALLSTIVLVCSAALAMFIGTQLELGVSPEEFADMVQNQFSLYGPAYPSDPIVAP